MKTVCFVDKFGKTVQSGSLVSSIGLNMKCKEVKIKGTITYSDKKGYWVFRGKDGIGVIVREESLNEFWA
ncbi:hypothetical protein [Agriterribacter sp.]|uniref:hypothetical protein n=1 Tax=Agriterribacter sp. TaxID=2821509 RepID=UPI002D1FAFA2|nr:hypothetical protein [Agriterribacter sp.]